MAVSMSTIDTCETSICAMTQLAFSAAEECSGKGNCNVSKAQHFSFSFFPFPLPQW